MLNPSDIAIISGARTPMGRYCEKLRDFTSMELGAIAGIEAIKRSGIDPRNSTTLSSATHSRLLQTRTTAHGTSASKPDCPLKHPRSP